MELEDIISEMDSMKKSSFESFEVKEKNLKLKLLNETAIYYQENPRAASTNGCKYIMEDGRKCAAGRLFSEQAIKEISDTHINGTNLPQTISYFSDKDIPLFKEEYQWLIGESSFLKKLQYFHDSLENWQDGELSERGVLYFQDMVHEIEEGKI